MKASDPLKTEKETRDTEAGSSVPKQGTAAYSRWLDEQITKHYLECDLAMLPQDKDGNPIRE